MHHALRDNILKSTKLATAQFDTIRLRLLKVVVHVKILNTKIIFYLPQHFPNTGNLYQSSKTIY